MASVSYAQTQQAETSHWVHDLDPFLFRFPEWLQIGPVEGIRWYGLAYVAGFVIAAFLLHLYWKRGKSPLGPSAQSNLLIAGFLGVLIGGRVGYMLFYDLPGFLDDPLILFQPWRGGMASHGGFIGVTIALVWYSRAHGITLRRLGDIGCTLVPPGLMLGRIANFINGELWGKVSDVSWAVIFPKSASVEGLPPVLIEPRHPSQLYQALTEGLLLLIYVQWRFWRGKNLAPGQLAGEFLIGYAIARIVSEVFREPDAGVPLILGLSRGQFLSVFLLLAGIGVIIWARSRRDNT